MKTQSIVRSALLAVAAAGALFTVAGPAMAEDNSVSVHIPLDRFDLSKPGDQGAVQWKIRTAARQICGVSNSAEIDEPVEVRRRLRDALKSGAEQLATLNASHSAMLAGLDIKSGSHSK